MSVPREVIAAAPKVTLHDHLDGGVHPATLIELADDSGYAGLPAEDPDVLAAHIAATAAAGDLPGYLATFAHTTAVLQHRDALARVASEAVRDLAADGCVYAEIRFAPELHTTAGLTMADTCDAVLAGLADGQASARSAGRQIVAKAIVCAIRTGAASYDAASAALEFRDRGVVGFDIAGAEAGHPPSVHAAAFDAIRDQQFHLTIHAGEAFGVPSVAEALGRCGAERLGHGIRIIDDITWDADTGRHQLGRVAQYVLNRRIPLEVCPSSNVHTGAVPSIAEHPAGLLHRLGFRVGINCDNRLMSATTLTDEHALIADAFNWGLGDLERSVVGSMKAAFCDYDLRAEIIDDTLRPWYAAQRRCI